jgi:hypothetical protein
MIRLAAAVRLAAAIDPDLPLVSVCYRVAKFLATEIVHAETLFFFLGMGARSSSILERNSLRIGEVFALL